MNTARFRFHGRLKDFLPAHQRHITIPHLFDWRASIKDMIESLGPPHCEIEALHVNGTPVDFDYIVQPDTQIEVYDHIPNGDNHLPLRPAYPGTPRFVLDTHLGRLAAYLRMLGFDTLYRNDYPDNELAFVSNTENRILLTRDIGLLKRSLVIYGYFMRETNPKRRVVEIVQRYDLRRDIQLFRYCTKCNGNVQSIEKATILSQLAQNTIDYYDEFHQCQNCDQIYWKGAHFEKISTFIQDVLDEA